jgi:hypothetical protein
LSVLEGLRFGEDPEINFGEGCMTSTRRNVDFVCGNSVFSVR